MLDKGFICEVAPRDGLQSASIIYSVQKRVRFIENLLASGLTQIEVGSLVRADLVPAMADSDKVFQSLQEKHPESVWKNFILLVPNEKGLEKALSFHCRFVAFFTATSETFNQKNIRMSVADSITRIENMMQSLPSNVRSRLYISTVFDCPFEGTMPVEKLKPFENLMLMADEVSLGDTTGKGKASQIPAIHEIVKNLNITDKIFWHFHDTYLQAEDNVQQAIELGYLKFDSSAGGIGGCPFAPGAKGNIATEKVIRIFQKNNINIDVDVEKLKQAVL
ncbi:MAG: hydroxymethylglutaryl-CoA lyase [Candidatus Hydrogenedentota bacterium]|nr:MAG: hydroxymethylglutaryl-CoA lyase [Candidatus Hydrogenedentota bacterium]